VAVFDEDAILTAPGTKFLRRSFVIEPCVASLFTLSAAFFPAIGCGSYRGSGSSFLVVPEFPTLLLNGSGAQVAQAGDIIEVYVQLVLWMHVLVQPVYLIFLGEASGLSAWSWRICGTVRLGVAYGLESLAPFVLGISVAGTAVEILD